MTCMVYCQDALAGTGSLYVQRLPVGRSTKMWIVMQPPTGLELQVSVDVYPPVAIARGA